MAKRTRYAVLSSSPDWKITTLQPYAGFLCDFENETPYNVPLALADKKAGGRRLNKPPHRSVGPSLALFCCKKAAFGPLLSF